MMSPLLPLLMLDISVTELGMSFITPVEFYGNISFYPLCASRKPHHSWVGGIEATVNYLNIETRYQLYDADIDG